MNMEYVLASLVCGFSLTWLVKYYAVRAKLWDIPNQRSSHTVPTPRGGGFSIVLVTLGFIGLRLLGTGEDSESFAALLAAGALVAGTGFIDDHRHVRASIRFMCHLAAATLLVVAAGGIASVQFGAYIVNLGIVGSVVAVVSVVWFINLFNFMDGIDGIASVEAISISVGGLILLGPTGGVNAMLFAVVGAATLGFLFWNWPPARIFMGDVGSGFLGFILAGIAVLSMAAGETFVWTWLILGGVFIVDATVTLLVRVLRREVWHSAHRSHSYQRLSRKVGNHWVVTLGVAAINVLWLLPIAWIAHKSPESGWWLTAVAWLPLTIVAIRSGAGCPD